MSRLTYALTQPLCLVCRVSARVIYTREAYENEMRRCASEERRCFEESLTGATIIGLLAIVAHTLVKTL
jgi:hypothetical protein